MKAMVLEQTVDMTQADEPLRLVERETPTPGPGERLLQVEACGVCHTELDEIEGRTPPSAFPRILGHQVVGRPVDAGAGVDPPEHDRLGVAWIYSACGECLQCTADRENLCADFQATGRDADGGYAEYMVVPAAFACPVPDTFDAVQAAPLLCAGAVGYRSLRLTGIGDGQRLGLTGFGASAHLVLQLVREHSPHTDVYVFARNADERAFARDLGAVWAGDTAAAAPAPLHAVIDTTPAWKPVVEAMANLLPGGRLVVNAIRKQADDQDYLLKLEYDRHLWLEKEIKSVANVTRRDVADFLRAAAEVPLQPTVETFPLADANTALAQLKRGQVRGSKVLVMA